MPLPVLLRSKSRLLRHGANTVYGAVLGLVLSLALNGTAAPAHAAATPPPTSPATATVEALGEPAILIKLLPDMTLDQASANLIRAITSNNYTYVRQQAIDARLVPQEFEAKTVRIIYFCNFAKMERAFNIDVRAAQVMPCRFTLVEADGGVSLIAINPAWISEGLRNPLLHPDCLELKRDYLAIMEEAAL